MRRINRRFAVFLLALLVVLTVGACVLHAYQVKRHAGALLAQAARAEEQGRLDRAVDYLNRYLALNPRDTDALALYGLTLEKLARNDRLREQAFLVLERVLQRDAARQDVRRRLVPLAVQMRRFADAAEHVHVLLAANPEDAELLGLLGACEEGAGHPNEAKAAYERAIAQGPHRIEIYVRLADLLRRRLNRASPADACVEEMIARNGDSFRAYLLRGFYYKEFNALDKAAQSMAGAYALAPDDGEVLLAMAVGVKKTAAEDGRKYLERGAELYPKDERFCLALAELELRANRPAEAARRLRDGLKNAPHDLDVLWNVADLLLDAGEAPEVRTLLTRLRKEGYPTARTDYLEGRLLLGEGAWLQAAGRFNQALPQLATTPELAKRVHLFLGRCYEQLGNPDLALAAYRQASSTDPLWVPARAGVASASLTLGKVEAALDEYRAIQAQSPEGRLVFARLLILQNLNLSARERNWAEVEQVLAQAEKSLPDAVEVPILRVEVLAGQNKLAEAAALLDAVEPARRKHAPYWVARAGLAERLRQAERVLPLLEEGEALLGPAVELRLARARYWSRHPGPAADAALAKLEAALGQEPADDRTRLRYGLAEAHDRLGHDRDAARLWAQVAETEGQENSLHVRFLLFDLALRQGDDAQLRKLIGQVRAIEGDDGALWRYGEAARLVRRAQEGDRSGLESARAHLLEVAKRRPAWSRVPLLEAALAELEGNAEEVIKASRSAIERGERSPQVVRRAVQMLCERRRFVEADQLIRRLPEQAPVSGELVKLAAEISLRKQETQRALELAQAAVTAESRDYRDRIWVGQLLWALGRNDEAEGHLRQAVALAEDRPEAWVALVQFFARTGQAGKADVVLHDARAHIPAEGRALALAQCYEALGQTEPAEEQYGEALAARPDDASALRAAADYYLRSGRPDRAEPYLRHVLDAGVKAAPGELAWARRNLAFALALREGPLEMTRALALLDENRQGKSESAEDQRTRAVVLALQPGGQAEAIRLLEHLARRQPLTPDERFLLAKLYETEGDWRKARAALLSLVTSQGDQPLYLSHYVNSLVQHGEADEAQFWLPRLEKLEPNSSRTVDLKTRVLQQRGKTEEAVAVVKDYARGKDVPPGLVAALLDGLGPQAADEAEAAYRRWLADSKRPEDGLRFAGFLARHGRLDEALGWCERAGTDAPRTARATVGLLRTGQATEPQVRKVENWLAHALAKSSSPDLLLALAELRDYQGRYDEAVAVYRQALRDDPRSSVALNNLAWLLVLHGGAGGEALQTINRAIEQVGPVPGLLDTRAVIYLHLNKPDQALQDLERVIARAPSASAQFHRAQACLARQDRAAAARALRTAKAAGLDPTRLHPLEHAAHRRLLATLEGE